MEQKPAVKSLGVLAPAFALAAIALEKIGVHVSVEVSPGALMDLQALADSVTTDSLVIAGLVAGMVGRIRANSVIRGVFRVAAKAMKETAE